MLDHDQLLPEEQVNPILIQELRATYQLTPAERQVLARVHERLAQHSYPLPVHEPIQLGNYPRSLQLVPPVPALAKPARTSQGWLRRLNTIAGIIFLVLLVGSLVFVFTTTRRTSVGSHSSTGSEMRILLVPAETFSVVSQQEMQAAGTILSQRFTNFGLQGSSVHVQLINGQPGLLVELPRFNGNEQQTINSLLGTGILAFWNTGPSTDANSILAQGTAFDSRQYIQYNPGGRPRFTNQDLDPTALTVILDSQTGAIQINGMMKGDAISRFGQYTATYVGYALTITLDGKVLSSASIAAQITGPFVITGKFTQQQARAIVSILKETPLPFALKEVN